MKICNETALQVAAVPALRGDGAAVLTVVIKGTFAFEPDGTATLAAEQLPIFFADETGDAPAGCVRFESDLAPFKPRADIALVGMAHVPGGQRTRALEVSLRVGSTKKTLRVFGDRRWRCAGRFLPARMTPATPFTTMPIVYDRAFGGVDAVTGGFSPFNLVGQGMVGKKRRKSLNNKPLPNIEDPRHLIRSWKNRPPTAGFGFYAKGWEPRVGHLGTHDERWRTERAPLPPEDFREDFYNAAHPDLQVAGYLRGDEEVELIHLTPEARLVFRLSGLRPACAVTPAAGGSDRDVPLVIDTLCLLPDEALLYQVWRGCYPLQDLDPSEVSAVTIRLDDAPKS